MPARPFLTALALGIPGAGIAALLGLPAGPLIGAAIVTAIGAGMGLRPDIPPLVRDAGFSVIGVTLGAGILPGFLSDIWRWAPSLSLLLIAQVVTIVVGARIAMRVLQVPADTAYCAASPGALSSAIALAMEGKGDATPVLILQVLRIFVLVTLTPPLALLISEPVTPAAADPMNWGAFALCVLVAFPLGRLGAGLGLPAACLLVGMIVSGLTHGFGITHGRPPAAAVFTGFMLAGTGLGARLTGVRPRDILRYAGVTGLMVGSAAAISLVFAMIAARLSGIDPGAAWIAFAPGGVEAMAAIGLALGYDPAFIATHHLLRIIFLTILVPVLIARLRR